MAIINSLSLHAHMHIASQSGYLPMLHMLMSMSDKCSTSNMECTYSGTNRHVHMYISCIYTEQHMLSVCHVAQVCNAGVLVLATIFGGLFAIDVACLL